MKTNVVIVGGISLLRPFAYTSLPLHKIVVTRSSNTITKFSRYANEHYVMEDPVINPDRVVQKLVEISSKLDNKPALIYGDDEMLLVISRNRGILKNYYNFAMPEESIVEACTDKQKFGHIAIEYSLPVPKTINASSINSCSQLNEITPFPVIFKPLLSTGKTFVSQLLDGKPQKILLAETCSRFNEYLKKIKAANESFAIQPFISGGEEEIYSFHTFANDKYCPISSYVGKKVRTYPSTGGISTCVELINNEEILKLGTELVKTLKITGPVKIDFKKDTKTGRFYLLELNLRFNLWNYLGARCGINLLDIALHSYNNLSYTNELTYKTGVKWISFGDDFRTFLKCYRPEGKLSLYAWIKSLLGKNIYHVFLWKDPMPFVMNIFFNIFRASRKILYKIT